MTPSRFSCLFRMVAAVAMVAAGCVAGAEPAGSVSRPVITVRVGEAVATKFPALVGANYQQGRRPASCSPATRVSCDTIPVVLDVSLEELQEHSADYVMQVETNWNVRTTQTVPAVGSPSDNQVNTYVYTDPPRVVEGVITEEVSAFIEPPPTVLTLSPVPSNAFLITVENMFGANDGYTLTVTLFYVGGDAPVDLSADEGGQPFDFSDTDTFAETPSFNDLSPTNFDTVGPSPLNFADLASPSFGAISSPGSSVGTAAREFNLNLADVEADADLDGIAGVDNASVLKLQKAQKIENIAASGPPPIRDVSGVVLALWLLVVPFAAAAVFIFFAFRRRAVLAGMS